MEGTGSILMVAPNLEINNDTVRVHQNSIRFLSPREIANLHCFPNSFGNLLRNIFID